MKKLLFLLHFLLIYSCESNSQNVANNSIKETPINSSEYDNTKAVKRNFSLNESDEDSIKIVLDNNETITFINNKGVPFDENRVSYFMDSLDSKSILINVKEYENDYYLLVNKELGKIDTLPAYPYFSKNKMHLLVVDYNPYETYEDIIAPSEDIYIYRSKENELELIYKKPFQSFTETYLESFYWKNDNEIYLKFIDESNSAEKEYLSIKLTD